MDVVKCKALHISSSMLAIYSLSTHEFAIIAGESHLSRNWDFLNREDEISDEYCT